MCNGKKTTSLEGEWGLGPPPLSPSILTLSQLTVFQNVMMLSPHRPYGNSVLQGSDGKVCSFRRVGSETIMGFE